MHVANYLTSSVSEAYASSKGIIPKTHVNEPDIVIGNIYVMSYSLIIVKLLSSGR